ncbi:hypothetical protein LTR53_000994 [Teratosphaeriaceae sp. CCFEE 6253]|nr:hypothetical protein LTR53_000994 [Teratosphaeriaceae sp. CCFEE 6253]
MFALHHAGQRLSLKDRLCTVRYVGFVDGKKGEWLGVEWDDPTRGKHNGTHEGKKYFGCRSNSSTCASFLRPNQPWDEARTFLEALREKYVPKTFSTANEAIYFSSKQAEEIGFEKFSRRQAELRGIHAIVLDRMRIRHCSSDLDANAIAEVCQEITDLDIGGNLLESLDEVYDLCRRLPKLRSLTLDGNRFAVDHSQAVPPSGFANIRTLSLSNVLLDYDTELVPLLRDQFPQLHALTATYNQWATASALGLPASLRALDLSNDAFTSLADLPSIASSSVDILILKNCHISALMKPLTSQASRLTFPSVRELDIRHNSISSWSVFDALPITFPALKHIRTTGNPLYTDLQTHDDKPLTLEDGYMLTLARLPSLETLNYSKITDKERLNAETYYLSLIAAEISAAITDAHAAGVRKSHPRWQALCEKYGEPTFARNVAASDGEIDPNSLAAGLVRITFAPADGALAWTEEMPKTLSVYEVLGVVGKKMGVMPLRSRLVLETGEQDPVGQKKYEGPEWWCSDDEEDGDDEGVEAGQEGKAWKGREVEMVAGTRALGTYVEGAEARVRVVVVEGP